MIFVELAAGTAFVALLCSSIWVPYATDLSRIHGAELYLPRVSFLLLVIFFAQLHLAIASDDDRFAKEVERMGEQRRSKLTECARTDAEFEYSMLSEIKVAGQQAQREAGPP